MLLLISVALPAKRRDSPEVRGEDIGVTGARVTENLPAGDVGVWRFLMPSLLFLAPVSAVAVDSEMSRTSTALLLGGGWLRTIPLL